MAGTAIYIEYDRDPAWDAAFDHLHGLTRADLQPLIDEFKAEGAAFLRDHPEMAEEFADETEAPDDDVR